MKRTEAITVLCIASDAQNLNLLKTVVNYYCNFEVVSASKADEITEVLTHRPVDLILYHPSHNDTVLNCFETSSLEPLHQSIPLLIIENPELETMTKGLNSTFRTVDWIHQPLQELELIRKLRFYLKDLERKILTNTIRNEFVSTCKDAIVILDTHLNIITANPSGEQIFKDFYHTHTYKETSLPNILRTFHESIHTMPLSVDDTEVSIHDKTYLFSIVPLPNETIKLQWHDITKYKEQEMQLIEQNKFAVTGEMLASIAHQWRQPLNIINLIMVNLQDDFEDGILDEERLEKHMEQSKRQVKYLSDTIDDFRNFFKPSKEKEFFCPRSTIEEIMSLLTPELKAHGIEANFSCNCFEHKVCDTCQKFYAVKNSFQHVILNILNNAKDAIVAHRHDKNGTITICIESSNPLIVHVKDNGGGINPEHMDDIFKPYFSTKGPKMGTGLGLYMAKTIVEKYLNGKLLVANKEEGACFTISLKE